MFHDEDAYFTAIYGPDYDQAEEPASPPAPSPPAIPARTISDRWCRCCRWNDATTLSGFCAGCEAEVAADLAERAMLAF